METWPYNPDLAVPVKVGKRVLESRAVSGAKKQRVKSETSRTLELRFENRDDAEWDAAVEFWDEHYPGVLFWYEDHSYTTVRKFAAEFISELQHVTNGYNDRSYSFQIQEVPGDYIPPCPLEGIEVAGLTSTSIRHRWSIGSDDCAADGTDPCPPTGIEVEGITSTAIRHRWTEASDDGDCSGGGGGGGGSSDDDYLLLL